MPATTTTAESEPVAAAGVVPLGLLLRENREKQDTVESHTKVPAGSNGYCGRGPEAMDCCDDDASAHSPPAKSPVVHGWSSAASDEEEWKKRAKVSAAMNPFLGGGNGNDHHHQGRRPSLPDWMVPNQLKVPAWSAQHMTSRRGSGGGARSAVNPRMKAEDLAAMDEDLWIDRRHDNSSINSRLGLAEEHSCKWSRPWSTSPPPPHHKHGYPSPRKLKSNFLAGLPQLLPRSVKPASQLAGSQTVNNDKHSDGTVRHGSSRRPAPHQNLATKKICSSKVYDKCLFPEAKSNIPSAEKTRMSAGTCRGVVFGGRITPDLTLMLFVLCKKGINWLQPERGEHLTRLK